jgi:spore coat polysaccharide biosynthesis protein SpsF
LKLLRKPFSFIEGCFLPVLVFRKTSTGFFIFHGSVQTMEEEYTLTSTIPRRPASARPVVIIQARMGSTRLPGKVMLPMNGVPMLQGMLERLLCLQPHVPLLLATTTSPDDAVLAQVGERMGVLVFRGSEDDVLDRFAKAVATTPADTVVRLTADCPLTDPLMIDKALDLFYHVRPDYLSNTLRRTYPRGFDIEIFSREALEIASREAIHPREREHVTPYILTHSERFVLANFASAQDYSSWRLTVDTKEDFVLVERVLSALGKQGSFEMVTNLLDRHPEWQKMNAHVKQKQE